jgi:hypothetical protein
MVLGRLLYFGKLWSIYKFWGSSIRLFKHSFSFFLRYWYFPSRHVGADAGRECREAHVCKGGRESTVHSTEDGADRWDKLDAPHG